MWEQGGGVPKGLCQGLGMGPGAPQGPVRRALEGMRADPGADRHQPANQQGHWAGWPGNWRPQEAHRAV